MTIILVTIVFVARINNNYIDHKLVFGFLKNWENTNWALIGY